LKFKGPHIVPLPEWLLLALRETLDSQGKESRYVSFSINPLTLFVMPSQPILRDNTDLYGLLLEEMFHEYVPSDTFCSHNRQEREELVGAYEEIKALINKHIAISKESFMAKKDVA
jgi:hypothetical protein